MAKKKTPKDDPAVAAEQTDTAAVEVTVEEAQSAASQAAAADTPAPDAQEQLAASEAQVRELRDQLLYRQAELENFKKRTEKRYRDLLEYAAEPLLQDLLPVLDNMQRAVGHAHEVGAEGFTALLEGLDHVIVQFVQALEKHGVEAVPARGEKFDPSVHDAMAQVPGDADGLVADVYENGYRLKARLLRPAKVTVTKVASAPSDG